MSLLKITAIGHLGRDPELKYTPDGKLFTAFTMACSEKKKDRQTQEMKEITTWLRVTFFGRQAEIASQYLAKGKQVYIEGRGRLEEYTDRDGKQRTTLEVFGTELQLIALREEGGGGYAGPPNYQRPAQPQQRQAPPQAYAQQTPTPLNVNDDEDIPF
jgi:single-strand DNA-binding protein